MRTKKRQDGVHHVMASQQELLSNSSNKVSKPRDSKPPIQISDHFVANSEEPIGRFGVSKGKRGVYDIRNPLNELTGKEWVQFTRSWEIHNPPSRKGNELLHPAKFPETLIYEFIRFFTKENEIVLDPMLGTGSTLVACKMANRRGVGIELSKKWANIARNRAIQIDESDVNQRQIVIEGDSRNLVRLLAERGINTVDFCITSPPYWNMLRKSRGHVKSESKKRKENGLDTYYGEDLRDYGNIDDYEGYLDEMYSLFASVYKVLKDQRYLVVIAQNVLTQEGKMAPIAWDLAKRLGQLYTLKQEKIWLQDNKMLGSWGYPFEYVSNVHHHYCLIFKKDESKTSKGSD